jgi:hypothetical protein
MPPIAPIRRTSFPSSSLPLPISYASLEAKLPTIPHHELPKIKDVSPSSTTFRTLTISLPRTTYATIVLLGDSFPSSTSPPLPPTTIPAISTVQDEQAPPSGTSSGATVGIVIGCVVGLVLLLAVGYVWFLRARQPRNKRRRKGKVKEKSKAAKKRKRRRAVRKAMRKAMKRSLRKKRRRRNSGKSVAVSLFVSLVTLAERSMKWDSNARMSSQGDTPPAAPAPAPAEPAPAEPAPAPEAPDAPAAA